jgi:hypothetical protein
MEISPEKPETMDYLLGQDPERYKMAVDKKCLQVRNFSIAVIKFAMKTI